MDDSEKLKDLIEKKMKTIMVGSLAIIEEEIGDYFVDNPEIYAIIRKRIFDNGNNQINSAINSMKTYEVKSKRYKLTLPVKRI